MKSEPGTYSIDDLARDGKTCWEGVRNYQARNFMRDRMAVGDVMTPTLRGNDGMGRLRLGSKRPSVSS